MPIGETAGETLDDAVVKVAWAEPGAAPVAACCRACGEPGAKPVLLDAEGALPGQGTLRARFLHCPACTCAFAEREDQFDYTRTGFTELNVAHYVEVSGGAWPMIRPLARLPFPAGATYLELGCGFGFALDYATLHRGWRGRGIDPSPFAQAGRAMLGLPIEHRYFGAEEAAQTECDVILASEVIEHIADPLAFVRTLRSALNAGGVLAITTPNRDHLRRDVPLAELVPILSVGAHLVLLNERSMRALLLRAGFGHVVVEAGGPQLVAYASDRPLCLAETDEEPSAGYRTYLAKRGGLAAAGSYLRWGMLARAYSENVGHSLWPEADRIWVELRGDCREGYGFDLDDPGSVPATLGVPLHEWRARVPGPLASLLYLRVLHRLGHAAGLAEMEPMLAAAARVAEDLTTALRALAAEDQATLGVQRCALGLLAGSLADRADPAWPEMLRRAVEADPSQETSLARRCFAGLVNAGSPEEARRLQARWNVDAEALDRDRPAALRDPASRDALFCLAVADLAEGGAAGGDVARARARFEAFRRQGPDQPLYWPAVRGECLAADRMGDHRHATALLAAQPASALPADLLARLSDQGAPPGASMAGMLRAVRRRAPAIVLRAAAMGRAAYRAVGGRLKP